MVSDASVAISREILGELKPFEDSIPLLKIGLDSSQSDLGTLSYLTAVHCILKRRPFLGLCDNIEGEDWGKLRLPRASLMLYSVQSCPSSPRSGALSMWENVRPSTTY